MKTPITTALAPKAIGPYSQAIRSDKHVYFSGQIPLDPQTMELVSDDVKMQVQQVFKNMQQVALAAGGSLNHMVKLTIYLTDLSHFSILNEVMLQYFTEPFPARTTIQVSALPKAAKVEIEAVMRIE